MGAGVGGEAWRRTLAACGVLDDALVDFAAETHSRLAREAHRLFDDVRPVIDAARDRGIALALVTNGATDTQREKLDALGIERWFDVIVVSGEIGVAKPDITPFRVALDAIGVAAADAWHVGDGLHTDVAWANAAGLTSVWLNRNGRVRSDADPVPDVEVRSLRELIGVLEEPGSTLTP